MSQYIESHRTKHRKRWIARSSPLTEHIYFLSGGHCRLPCSMSSTKDVLFLVRTWLDCCCANRVSTYNLKHVYDCIMTVVLFNDILVSPVIRIDCTSHWTRQYTIISTVPRNARKRLIQVFAALCPLPYTHWNRAPVIMLSQLLIIRSAFALYCWLKSHPSVDIYAVISLLVRLAQLLVRCQIVSYVSM